jgi:hypothetical protein
MLSKLMLPRRTPQRKGKEEKNAISDKIKEERENE